MSEPAGPDRSGPVRLGPGIGDGRLGIARTEREVGRRAAATRGPRWTACRPRELAFTLVELLVVVAIVALLISILLPSFKRARDQAKAVKCGGLQHGFANGLATYYTEYQQWIPGRNTSGMATWAAGYRGQPAPLSRADLPVQTYDWLTPILRTETQLPANRAKRFRTLVETYACPAVNFRAILWVDRSSGEQMPIDHALFVAEVESGGAFLGGSYLMPVHFQQWGRNEQRIIGMHPEAPVPYTADQNPASWEVKVVAYRSRVDAVGAPAEKIAVADGTRYLTVRQVLDFDHDHQPGIFGAFTSAGGWWSRSTAYGERNSPSAGRNVPLSFRHRDGISALFFDGHVGRLSRRAARKIDYWYPKGGVVVKSREGITDYDTYADGYVIR